MALSANQHYRIKPAGLTTRLPVKDATTIYQNALVGLNLVTGYVEPYDDAAGVVPVGLCMREVTGDTSQTPAVCAELRTDGPVLEDVAIAGVTAVTKIGDLVYATDDATFTLTRPADDATPIGRVHAYHGTSGYGDLRLFPAAQMLEKGFAPMTGKASVTSPSFQCETAAANDVVAVQTMHGSGTITGFRLRVTDKFGGTDTGELTFALRVNGVSIGTATVDCDGTGASGGAVMPTTTNAGYGIAESGDLTPTAFHDGDVVDVILQTIGAACGAGMLCAEWDAEATV